MEERKNRKIDQIAVYVENKTGDSLMEWGKKIFFLLIILLGVFAMFRWFQGDTHKDYKQLYEQLEEANEELLKDNERITLSIDTIRQERDQMMSQRDIAIDLLKTRPHQVVQVIRDYEDLYNDIDNAPLDSIAVYLAGYHFDNTAPIPGSRSHVQP